MAASYVPGADEPASYAADAVFHGKSLTRSWSSKSSSSSSSASSGEAPRCVCAPPTHARSFKCRLHRNSSIPHGGHHHHHHPGGGHDHGAPVTQQHQAAEAARTVEA